MATTTTTIYYDVEDDAEGCLSIPRIIMNLDQP